MIIGEASVETFLRSNIFVSDTHTPDSRDKRYIPNLFIIQGPS